MTQYLSPISSAHYNYVETVSEEFSTKLSLNYNIHLSLSAHGDKARQYKDIAENLGIPYGKLLLVYLLSYESGWSNQVRETENGWVSIEDWLIEKLTKDQKIIEVLESLPTVRALREIDDSEFEILEDGELIFKCKREDISKGGLWLVFNNKGTLVDRDMYSNDIFERAFIPGKYY